MGDEVGGATKKALLTAVKARAVSLLDESLEMEKQSDPFLDGADAIAEALADGRIDCRVYNRDKFHAKAYITHGRLEVVGSQALVGSSNFTRAGLTQNVELNIRLESSSEVDQLQRWYEDHWRQAEQVSPEMTRLKVGVAYRLEHRPRRARRTVAATAKTSPLDGLGDGNPDGQAPPSNVAAMSQERQAPSAR